MVNILQLSSLVLFAKLSACAPLQARSASPVSNPAYGPIPGESSTYSTYYGTAAPFPGNITGAVLNTTSGQPGPDDVLFQNLLSAEWIIFSFYQQGVEAFNQSSFTDVGFLNTTYQRVQQIRDNEAGHLRIFQDQITTNSVKPGPCTYKFPFTDAPSFLALQLIIEVASMAFLTGLELEAHEKINKAALVAIAATESRHNTWSLIDNWGASPFAGPSDTIFPYARQLLGFTNEWVVPGSCPSENPIYPSPDQNLPPLGAATNTTSIAPGAPISFVFTDSSNMPTFAPNKEYYAVFFHGVNNITMPFDTVTHESTIPSQFEQLGIIIVVIADKPGAPTEGSVVAGPLTLLENPVELGLSLLA